MNQSSRWKLYPTRRAGRRANAAQTTVHRDHDARTWTRSRAEIRIIGALQVRNWPTLDQDPQGDDRIRRIALLADF